jgi:hypothetical protein
MNREMVLLETVLPPGLERRKDDFIIELLTDLLIGQ